MIGQLPIIFELTSSALDPQAEQRSLLRRLSDDDEAETAASKVRRVDGVQEASPTEEGPAGATGGAEWRRSQGFDSGPSSAAVEQKSGVTVQSASSGPATPSEAPTVAAASLEVAEATAPPCPKVAAPLLQSAVQPPPTASSAVEHASVRPGADMPRPLFANVVLSQFGVD
eukprot:3207399-Pyramimonas_sp.AAC.1